jgi:hypothetical protein
MIWEGKNNVAASGIKAVKEHVKHREEFTLKFLHVAKFVLFKVYFLNLLEECSLELESSSFQLSNSLHLLFLVIKRLLVCT